MIVTVRKVDQSRAKAGPDDTDLRPFTFPSEPRRDLTKCLVGEFPQKYVFKRK